ncbi:MAG: DMT family transporter [Nannocystaceae bacterium]|nr:DMT family transporter [bacterium]
MREGTQVMGALGLGVAAVSSAATVILMAAPLPAVLIAAGRVLVTGVALILLGVRDIARWTRAVRSRPALAGRTVVAGALLAVHFAAWIASLEMTTVLRSTALVALQPVFAGLLGRVLGDRVSRWLYVGAAVSLGGTWVMVGGPAATAGGSLAGDGLALLGGAAAAAYLAVGRSVREEVPLRAYLGSVHLAAGVGLLLCAAVFLQPAGATMSMRSALAVLYLGLVPGVVGHGLFNWVVRQVPVDRVALAILLEPVGATLLAWIVLGRGVTTMEAVGAGIVLGGVAVGSLGRSTPAGC